MSTPSSSLEGAYKDKPRHYFDVLRNDLIVHIEPGGHRILDIGCSAGSTGQALKRDGKASEVVGVELTREAVAIAEGKLDRVLCGDIEQMELPYPIGYFDYILCGDVLEHLRDPWGVLAKLRAHLRSGGRIVASIPNIRNWRILANLVLRGRWDYTASGILDSTHLRFFTRSSIIEMFEGAGFALEEITHVEFGPKAKLINRFTFGLGEEFMVKQYIIKARN